MKDHDTLLWACFITFFSFLIMNYKDTIFGKLLFLSCKAQINIFKIWRTCLLSYRAVFYNFFMEFDVTELGSKCKNKKYLNNLSHLLTFEHNWGFIPWFLNFCLYPAFWLTYFYKYFEHIATWSETLYLFGIFLSRFC